MAEHHTHTHTPGAVQGARTRGGMESTTRTATSTKWETNFKLFSFIAGFMLLGLGLGAWFLFVSFLFFRFSLYLSHHNDDLLLTGFPSFLAFWFPPNCIPFVRCYFYFFRFFFFCFFSALLCSVGIHRIFRFVVCYGIFIANGYIDFVCRFELCFFKSDDENNASVARKMNRKKKRRSKRQREAYSETERERVQLKVK